MTPEVKEDAETRRHGDAETFAEICLGNEPAAQFCFTFCRWCHWVDDAVDGDRAWEADAVIRCNLEAVVTFSENEFFQRNKNYLLPLIVQSFRSFGDSIEWAKRAAVKDRRAADVLKSNYHEIYWHTAYLCACEAGQDAWAHLSAVTKKHREFNYDYGD
jgi:hypothetical protein